MFDDLQRKLKQLEQGVQVPIELELDDKGYLDRVCPFEECGTNFKIMFEDWRDIVRDEEVFCPLCRHVAESTEWKTPEQAEYIRQAAVAYVKNQIGQALLPAHAAEIMTQEFICGKCNCRYSSIGAAFFCPSCGYNSVLDTFANSLETVNKTLAAIPSIRTALIESADENVATDSVRHICENGLVKIISSFQRYSEACFHKLPNAGSFKIRRNLFQNLAESDAIWRNATGSGYTDLLDKDEYDLLSLYFQQRHVLAHLDGIVDQQYIDKSSDHRFEVGQRLIVSESSVTDLVAVIDKLAKSLAILT